MALLDELETLEGKRRVLGAVEVMVEREGVDVRPFLDSAIRPAARLADRFCNRTADHTLRRRHREPGPRALV